MKPLRYLGLALAGVLGLLALGAVLLFALFDETAIKQQLVAQVVERSGRQLVIEGKLGLSVWPDVAVQIAGVRLSDADGKGQFVSLKGARVGVAVLPLLAGKLQARRIEIDGLDVNLVKRRDGSLNIDDLAGAGKNRADAPVAEVGQPASSLSLEIAGIVVRDARVGWMDEATGKRTEIRDIDLSTGTLSGDTGSAKYHVREFALSSKGRLDKENFELTLDVPDFRLDGDKLQVGKIGLAARLSGTSRTVEARLGVMDVAGTLSALQIRQFDLAVEAALGEQQFKVSLTSPVALDLDEKALRLDKLAGQLTISSPSLPMKQLVLPLNGRLSAHPAKQNADLALSTQFDESKVDVALAVERFTPMDLRFKLAIDQLNVDRYLPPQATAGRDAGENAGSTESRIRLDALKGLDVHGTVNIGRLQAHRLKMSALDARVKLSGGRLEVAPLRAALYGGSMEGGLAVNANNSQFSMRQQLRGIEISPLLKDLADKDVLEGRGAVSLDVTTQGDTITALRQALSGEAALDLRDGAIKGVNVAKMLRDAKAGLSGKLAVSSSASTAEKTDFSALTASFRIDGGVARNNDLSLMSPFLRLGGEGAIDIGHERMDYLAKVSVVNTSTGQEGKDLAHVRGVTLPLRVRGPWAQLGYTLEMDKLLEEVAKAKLDENKEKLKQKATEKLGQELFKVFGR